MYLNSLNGSVLLRSFRKGVLRDWLQIKYVTDVQLQGKMIFETPCNCVTVKDNVGTWKRENFEENTLSFCIFKEGFTGINNVWNHWSTFNTGGKNSRIVGYVTEAQQLSL